MLFFKSSLGTGDLFGQKTSQAAANEALKKVKTEVPVYGLDKTGNSTTQVAEIRKEVQKEWSKPPESSEENQKLYEADQRRLSNNANYWEDAEGLRHYIDGRVVKVEYIERQ
jgi:hypothetical protein